MFTRLDEQAYDYVVEKMQTVISDSLDGNDYVPIFILMSVRTAQNKTEEDNREIVNFAKSVLKTAIEDDEIGSAEKVFLKEIVEYAI